MTLRFRNRLTLILFFIALVTFLVNIALLLFSIYNNTFFTNDYLGLNQSGRILVKNIPLCTIIAFLFKDIYVATFSLILYRSFIKTQATDIIFFELFLVSLLVDSLRLWIPLLCLQNTYSQLYIFCGNAGIFARFLGPIAILFTVIMGFTDQWQNLEKNMIILLLLSFITATFLPLNTAITTINFEVDYNFRTILSAYSIITFFVSLVMQFINNKNRYFSQHTTIGLALAIAGSYFLLYSTNIVFLFCGITLSTVGTIIFVRKLHNQYLWFD